MVIELRSHQDGDLAFRVLAELGLERRRVTSRWRLAILARRLAIRERRPLPTMQYGTRIAESLLRRSLLTPWSSPYLRGVYVISAPFADLVSLEEEQVLQEANPEGYFCFQSALLRHGISNEFAKHLTMASVSSHIRPPIGTDDDEWADLPRPKPQVPVKIGETPIEWAPTRSVSDVGVVAMQSTGGVIYITDLEKTLLDAVQRPELCLGVANVLRAWRLGSEGWNLDRLIAHALALRAGPVMRQRIGYLVEAVGADHPAIHEWRRRLQRGGSIKLVAARPYSSEFDERWNLSLNVPPAVLAELKGD